MARTGGRDLDALITFLEGRARMPFAWGRSRNDCISFGLGAVKAQTGVDLLAGSGLRWNSALSAARVLDRLGGMDAAISARLAVIPVAMAHRGDVGVVQGVNGPLLVVVEGDTVVGPDLNGCQRLPRSALIKTWTLGDGK